MVPTRATGRTAPSARVGTGAYTFWGLTPFLRVSGQAPLALEPLVLADPLLQRLLVSVIVKPAKVSGVNAEGARALQAHLLSPATQARIRSSATQGPRASTGSPPVGTTGSRCCRKG